jgi:hypothetical protein
MTCPETFEGTTLLVLKIEEEGTNQEMQAASTSQKRYGNTFSPGAFIRSRSCSPCDFSPVRLILNF